MQTITSPSIKPNPVEVAVTSARYLVDAKGKNVEVVLPLSAWENLLGWFEELEDRVIVREWLPKLKAGPFASGALRWEDIEAEWDDETK